jgi:hypothetical protein
MSATIAIVQLLLGCILITVTCSLLALPVLKFYARSLSWGKLVLVGLESFGPTTIALIVLYGVWIVGFHEPASSTPGLAIFAVFCGAGWLISKKLERLGFKKRFPGIGARALLSIFVFSWLIVGVVFFLHAF